MGSYKLLMQLLPPRDELLFSKASVAAVWKSSFSAAGLTRGLQGLLGPQPGNLGRR